DRPFETDGVPFLVARQRFRPASRTNGTWFLRCISSDGTRDRVATYSMTACGHGDEAKARVIESAPVCGQSAVPDVSADQGCFRGCDAGPSPEPSRGGRRPATACGRHHLTVMTS